MTEIAVQTHAFYAGRALPVLLHWDPADHFTVSIVFIAQHGPSGRPVRWLCAYGLLADGLDSRSTEGDMTIWPDYPHVGVGIDSVRGYAEIHLPWMPVVEFAGRVQRAMGAAVDAGLDRLLAGA